MATKHVTWREVYTRLAGAPTGRLFGIPRGGAIVAGLTGRAVDHIAEADWIVDDLIDSGSTASSWTLTSGKPIWGLFDSSRDRLADNDLIFPWDSTSESRQSQLEGVARQLLRILGYELGAPEIRETPRRWARWWNDFLVYEPGSLETTFEVQTAGQLVVVSGMRIWSICEHHLLPFLSTVSVGYLPAGHLLGLSKFARAAHRIAHRLQVQERMAGQLADSISNLVGTRDVAVLISGRHLCMEMRGVKTPAVTSSFVTLGAFQNNGDLKQDFLALSTRVSIDPVS